MAVVMCREYLFMRSVFVFLFMSVFAFVYCELYCLFLHVCLCKCAHKCVVISCSEEHLNILLSLRFLIYLVPISYFFLFFSLDFSVIVFSSSYHLLSTKIICHPLPPPPPRKVSREQPGMPVPTSSSKLCTCRTGGQL